MDGWIISFLRITTCGAGLRRRPFQTSAPMPTPSERPGPPGMAPTIPPWGNSDLDHIFSQNHHVWGRITQKTISNVGTDANAFGAAGAAGDGSYNPTMGQFRSGSYLFSESPRVGPDYAEDHFKRRHRCQRLRSGRGRRGWLLQSHHGAIQFAFRSLEFR